MFYFSLFWFSDSIGFKVIYTTFSYLGTNLTIMDAYLGVQLLVVDFFLIRPVSQV